MAAAREILRGKVLYRDIWFDKPPFYSLVYLLWGAHAGWPLRIAGALFVCITAFIAGLFAKAVGGEVAGKLGACLLAIFLTFDIHSSVLALAPDLLMVPLHLGAMYLAWRKRAFEAGFVAGLAMLFNTKALFVAAACALWVPEWRFALGFVLPNGVALAWMAIAGVLPDYWLQVWRWGMRYSQDTFLAHPLLEGLKRTGNWLGFHLALVVGVAVWMARQWSWRMAGWAILSLVAVTAGWRFFPRYYYQLLPFAVVVGAAGIALMRPRWRIVTLCLLLIPIVRFAPRYVTISSWPDLALMNDSRRAAELARAVAHPGDELLVWGYRPDVFVFSELPAATRYLDSQPLTGVLADRHLVSAKATAAELAAPNLREVERIRPAIIVDGLGVLNPELAADRYLPFLAEYQIAGRTSASIVYVTKR